MTSINTERNGKIAQNTKLRKHLYISIAGSGITVGSLATVIPFPTLMLFSIGIGIMLGGIFKGLQVLAERSE